MTFNDGLVPALGRRAIAVGIGALLALFIPRLRRSSEAVAYEPEGLAPQVEAF